MPPTSLRTTRSSAAHYRQARVWPEACRYQAHAGFAALERGAGREALACFDYALQAIPRLPNTEEWRELDVRLRLAANGASMTTGNYEGGRPYLLEAERDRRDACRMSAGRVGWLPPSSSCVRAAGELERALHLRRGGRWRLPDQSEDRPLESRGQVRPRDVREQRWQFSSVAGVSRADLGSGRHRAGTRPLWWTGRTLFLRSSGTGWCSAAFSSASSTGRCGWWRKACRR